MAINRRKFIGNTAALAAFSMSPAGLMAGIPAADSEKSEKSGKINSKFGGVQIGAITYSWRSMPGGLENIIKYCKEANISSLELMSTDLETFLGAPKNPVQGVRKPTPEQQEMINKYNGELKTWRLAVPMAKVAEAKKLFDNAGISVHLVKFAPSRWSDEEIDYAFKVAKAMGAKGVTDEIGDDAVKKLGPAAQKHGMFAVFHNHMQFATEGFSYDSFLQASPAVMMNFDAGHFFGSTGIHPNTIIEKYHDRIYSIHLKDKTGPKTEPSNANQVWGQGQMPIADVLLLIKKNKWPIYCDIELEYEIKPWSNAVRETKLCVDFARQILI